MNVRKRMVEERKRRNWFQEEVASKLNITQQSISQIEQGKRTPSLKLAKNIADIYEIPINELFPDIFLDINTTECNNH